MIHKNSTEPVLIKRIDINIWTLRDEVEALLQQRNEEEGSLDQKQVRMIRKEYKGAPHLKLVKEDEAQPLEILQRTSSLLPQEKVSKGIGILSEIGMNDFHFFSNKSYLSGQSIVLEFLIPRIFVLNAEILSCRMFNMKSRIIAKNKFPFRILAKFTFLKKGQRTLLREFIKSISP